MRLNSLQVANELRDQGANVMLYPEEVSLKKQLKYADNKSIPWVIVIGPDEVKSKKVQLKNMESGEQSLVDLSEITAAVTSSV